MNIAELYIGLIKEAVLKNIHALSSLMVLWDYTIERHSLTQNTITCPLFHNNGITPHEVTLV